MFYRQYDTMRHYIVPANGGARGRGAERGRGALRVRRGSFDWRSPKRKRAFSSAVAGELSLAFGPRLDRAQRRLHEREVCYNTIEII